MSNKILQDIYSYDDFLLLFRLYYKDEEAEYIMSISYDTNVLNEYINKYLNDNEIKNSWIDKVDLLLISKISLLRKIGLILKCDNDIKK